MYVDAAGDECVSVMMGLLGGAVVQCQDSLLAYVSHVVFPPHQVTNAYTIAAISLVIKVNTLRFI